MIWQSELNYLPHKMTLCNEKIMLKRLVSSIGGDDNADLYHVHNEYEKGETKHQ